jgi:hypothetical protein
MGHIRNTHGESTAFGSEYDEPTTAAATQTHPISVLIELPSENKKEETFMKR